MVFNIVNKFILFKYIFTLQKKLCTVNDDFVTFDKNQSISILKFNLPIMQHNLIGPQIGNFHKRYY
jgi:hypothetical protein